MGNDYNKRIPVNQYRILLYVVENSMGNIACYLAVTLELQ